MSRFISVVALTSFCAAPTLAGDVIGDITEPDIIAPQEQSSRSSVYYLGLSAGYGSGESDRFGLRVPGALFSIGDVNPSGSYGGVRAGWKGILPTRDRRDFVYGLELGYDFGTLDDSTTTRIGTTPVSAESAISDVFSVRLRTGVSNRKRDTLYFATLGYVSGDITTTLEGGPVTRAQEQDRRNGYSVSLGAEHQLNRHWSVTGEIEYVQFDSKTVDFGGGASTKSTPAFRGIRFGLNYAF